MEAKKNRKSSRFTNTSLVTVLVIVVIGVFLINFIGNQVDSSATSSSEQDEYIKHEHTIVAEIISTFERYQISRYKQIDDRTEKLIFINAHGGEMYDTVKDIERLGEPKTEEEKELRKDLEEVADIYRDFMDNAMQQFSKPEDYERHYVDYFVEILAPLDNLSRWFEEY